MTDLSPAQKKYLTHIRHEKYLIRISRIFLFLGFLLLWEISAREEWIDSFIFSSPSAIGQTFLHMIQDQSLFAHIGITLMETLISFAFVVLPDRERTSEFGAADAVGGDLEAVFEQRDAPAQQNDGRQPEAFEPAI